MVRDIVVTTPRSQMETAAEEAEQVKANGGGYYFRTFHVRPKDTEEGARCYYVEDGYLRGYARIVAILDGADPQVCSTTGKAWAGQYVVYMDAASWRWVKPVPMRGFQGWRYAEEAWRQLPELGDWLDPKPEAV